MLKLTRIVLTLSLAFLFLGKPDREMESLLSSKGVGSISQYEPCDREGEREREREGEGEGERGLIWVHITIQPESKNPFHYFFNKLKFYLFRGHISSSLFSIKGAFFLTLIITKNPGACSHSPSTQSQHKREELRKGSSIMASPWPAPCQNIHPLMCWFTKPGQIKVLWFTNLVLTRHPHPQLNFSSLSN